MSSMKEFEKSYWNYYIELEEQVLETKRYVSLDINSNGKTFSIEYLKLFQAVCSEIDVVGKEIATAVNSNFKIDNHTNIQKWGYEIQHKFKDIESTTIYFDEIILTPFENWKYVKTPNKKGVLIIKEANKKKKIQWWKDYNKVKHRRIGLVTGTDNFKLANQRNLINALAALYILEVTYMRFLDKNYITAYKSKLFKLKEEF